jgi:hypothetical protein
VGCEVLLDNRDSKRAHKILEAMAGKRDCRIVSQYTGSQPLVMLWGYGRPDHAAIVTQHVAAGGRAILWDLGYFGKHDGYCRLSLDRWHPSPELIEGTPAEPARWEAFEVELREEYKAKGKVIVAGMGEKSKRLLNLQNWEAKMRRRYPGSILKAKQDKRPIESFLKGASLLVCRHSNCAIDAIIAGVPFECSDGAALWLRDKPFTTENRLDFLRRLAWWQWKAEEAEQAWTFIEARI